MTLSRFMSTLTVACSSYHHVDHMARMCCEALDRHKSEELSGYVSELSDRICDAKQSIAIAIAKSKEILDDDTIDEYTRECITGNRQLLMDWQVRIGVLDSYLKSLALDISSDYVDLLTNSLRGEPETEGEDNDRIDANPYEEDDIGFEDSMEVLDEMEDEEEHVDEESAECESGTEEQIPDTPQIIVPSEQVEEPQNDEHAMIPPVPVESAPLTRADIESIVFDVIQNILSAAPAEDEGSAIDDATTSEQSVQEEPKKILGRRKATTKTTRKRGPRSKKAAEGGGSDA